jgi:hypothetical protein
MHPFIYALGVEVMPLIAFEDS